MQIKSIGNTNFGLNLDKVKDLFKAGQEEVVKRHSKSKRHWLDVKAAIKNDKVFNDTFELVAEKSCGNEPSINIKPSYINGGSIHLIEKSIPAGNNIYLKDPSEQLHLVMNLPNDQTLDMTNILLLKVGLENLKPRFKKQSCSE